MFRLRPPARSMSQTGHFDMTPMIDMVFLLLIFFLLTSVFSQQQVLDLALPTAAQARPEEKTDVIRLAIQKEGRIFVEEQEIPLAALTEVLLQKRKGEEKTTVFLSADRTVTFQVLIQVLDQLQGAGLSDLSIVTQTGEV